MPPGAELALDGEEQIVYAPRESNPGRRAGRRGSCIGVIDKGPKISAVVSAVEAVFFDAAQDLRSEA